MKIAVTAAGGAMEALVSEQFGRCPYFIIYDSETKKFEAVSNLGEQMQSGAGPKAAELLSRLGTDTVLTGKTGDKASAALKKAKIEVKTGYSNTLKVKDALDRFLKEIS